MPEVAFDSRKFSSFPRIFFKKNENLENVFGSFGFQKFFKKMKIFCFLTYILIKKLILVAFQNFLNVFSNILKWKMKTPSFQPNAFSKTFVETENENSIPFFKNVF